MAEVTISVRRGFSHTRGVDQVCPGSSRSTRHTSSPVAASSAARNDCVVLSLRTYSRPSCSAGDDAVAIACIVLNVPTSRRQISLPSKSRAATSPMGPKYT